MKSCNAESTGKGSANKLTDRRGQLDSELDAVSAQDNSDLGQYGESIEAGTPKRIAEPFEEGVKELEQQLAAKKGELVQVILQLQGEREKRRNLEENLHTKERELEKTISDLREVQIALKVLLDRSRIENEKIAELFLTQVKNGVFPYLYKLKNETVNGKTQEYLNVIESHLKAISPTFSENVSRVVRQLTPTEIQVADLVRDGMSSKEIASLLNLSTKAVDFHRNNIRAKLGLKSRKVSLKSHLASL